MDKTESTVRNILTAVEAPLYDIGVLSDRGMLPGLNSIPAAAVLDRLSLLKYRNARGSHIYFRPSGEHRFTVLDDLNETMLTRLAADGFNPCAVVETSAGNFQAWLKHPAVFPKLIGTLAAQTLAGRYDADPSAADWRRFGRLPGFTNCKPKYRKPDGLFPFVRLKSNGGEQYPMAEVFVQEITKLYEEREQEREARRLQASLSPQRGPRLSNLSLERFRTSTKYQERPAAADIAFCVAAYANGMTEDRIERALEDDYLSRDPSPSKRAAYIRRTMEKARRWAEP
jgi:RepB DNA-primase from phage plasmid